MNTITINGKELAYEVRGTGEPVLLLHCGFVADSFVPLMNDSTLSTSEIDKDVAVGDSDVAERSG